MPAWPSSAPELVMAQSAIARSMPPPWAPFPGMLVGGCSICFERGTSSYREGGERGWAAAALGEMVSVAEGTASSAYQAGLLALREGKLLEAAVRGLPVPPDVLLVNATGRDHPRRAGLALHLGFVVGLPTVGVTHRPLLAGGPWPPNEQGARAPLALDGEQVGYWLRTRRGTRPIAIHAAWRTDPDAAVETVLAALHGTRTPGPLRRARSAARRARAEAARED